MLRFSAAIFARTRDSSSSAAFASSSCLLSVCFVLVSCTTFPSASSSARTSSAFSLCERDLNALSSSTSRADCSNLAFNSASCDSRFLAIFSAWVCAQPFPQYDWRRSPTIFTPISFSQFYYKKKKKEINKKRQQQQQPLLEITQFIWFIRSISNKIIRKINNRTGLRCIYRCPHIVLTSVTIEPKVTI